MGFYGCEVIGLCGCKVLLLGGGKVAVVMLTAFLRAALYYLKPLYSVHFVYHIDYRTGER